MFRHHGKSRTLGHNLAIASLLSFVAGIVNVVGFLGIHQFTTNVTGHFAILMDEVLQLNFRLGFIYFLYIFCFFLGAFVSGMLVEFKLKKSDRFIFAIPAMIESVILISLAFAGNWFIKEAPNLLAFCLLFTMGLQNSLVTSISNSTVRTTHLTGLFTDLGIELSQLFFYHEPEQKTRLYSSIRLRIRIISFFFMGGIIGGLLYSSCGLYTLAIAGSVVLIGLFYDGVKMRMIQFARRNQ